MTTCICHDSNASCVAQVFLEGVAATMKADADFKGGWYDPQRPPTVGSRAFARVYAGWGFSQPFYWEKVCFPFLCCCLLFISCLDHEHDAFTCFSYIGLSDRGVADFAIS